MSLITMYDNNIDISSQQDGNLYYALGGKQKHYIVDGIGDNLSVTFNGLIATIGTGFASIYGRHITHNVIEDFTLPTNSTGYLVIRFTLGAAPGFESTFEAVSILEDDDFSNSSSGKYDLPLFYFNTSANQVENSQDVRVYVKTLFNIDASQITSGTVPVERIPGLTVNKIPHMTSDGSNYVYIYKDNTTLKARFGFTSNGHWTVTNDSQVSLFYIYNTGNINCPATYSNVVSTRPVYINSSGTFGTISSSKRYKEEIIPYTADYKKILDIEIVNFAYRDKTNMNDRQVGVIAEQVSEIGGLEDLVQYEFDYKVGKEIVDGFDYQKNLPLFLLGLCKEQQKEIDGNKKQLDNQQKLMDDLIVRIEKLESGV